MSIPVRRAVHRDLPEIRCVYNEGVHHRMATLETAVQIRRKRRTLVGRSSGPLRCSPVYVDRARRGTGVGSVLLTELEKAAIAAAFNKLVPYALDRNEAAKSLYAKAGFRHVGTFARHGVLDGQFVDVVAWRNYWSDAAEALAQLAFRRVGAMS